jgi:methylenetetrahydrofolate reductase (NADPH)
MLFAAGSEGFTIIVEVVPPAGPEAGPLLDVLSAASALPLDAFSVASNPVARARMSALALCSLIQQVVGRPAILHCTTRDHNRLSIQGLLWGAKALGIQTVLAATGDFVALGERARTTTVRDLDVFSLVRMAREAGLHAGVVLDPHLESDRFQREVDRLGRKLEAGAQFVVTQPVYAESEAVRLAEATRPLGIPIILGILPLWSARHAQFLHENVAGIRVPEQVRRRMQRAEDAPGEGASLARELIAVARQCFAGACLMPPFGHHEVLAPILASG